VTSVLDRAADRLEGRDDTPSSRRARLLVEYPTAAAFGQHFDYQMVITDAIALIDGELRDCVLERSGRRVISMPPQEGKSTLLRWFCVRLLLSNPEWRIGYVSYAASLARDSGRFVRDMIETHTHEMGISVSRASRDASRWDLEGHRGGMVAVGIGGALTGRPIDFLVIDDPLSGQKDADSVKVLGNQEGWWKSVGRTRFAPGASVVITQTRWAEADLAGNRVAEGWPLINIPALADGETPDALSREPGVYLTSTRERTPLDWQETRADVGERVWAALYQGRPSPLEGGIFQREWVERNRRQAAPALRRVLTMIDPADNTGSGDEAGVITAALGDDERYYILADDSDHMTVARWFRVAYLAALRWGSHEVCYEQSLSGLKRRAREIWRDMLSEARALYRRTVGVTDRLMLENWDETVDEEVVYETAESLAREDATDDEVAETAQRLRELWAFVPKILTLPETGLPVRAIKPEGDKRSRATLVSPLYETDKVSHVGTFPLLEHVLVTWQEGQSSPDRMDADIHVLLQLSAHAATTKLSRPTGRIPTRSVGGYGAPMIGRSTQTNRGRWR
jgi:hypothetical protein